MINSPDYIREITPFIANRLSKSCPVSDDAES